MRSLAMPILLALAAAPAADAASKVFYLDHAAAVGLPKLLDGLTLAKSPWVEELQPHWAELRAGVKVRADVNAIEAQGSAEALGALKFVLDALDVPRRTVKLSCRHVRVTDPGMLVGRPAGPPTAGPPAEGEGREPVPLRVAPGDWLDRVQKLVEADQATVLEERTVSALDGSWGAIYVGDPETDPEFLFQAKPTLTEDGEVWVTLAFGRIAREAAEGPGSSEAVKEPERPGLCLSCGPGIGDIWFLPEVTVSCVWPEWQSLLVEGPMWWKGEGDRPTGRGQDFVIVTAEVDD